MNEKATLTKTALASRAYTFWAPGLTLAVLLLFASPRFALATLIDFDDVSVDGIIGNSLGILPGNQYASQGVSFRTGSLSGTVSVGGTVTLSPPSTPPDPFTPPDPIDELEVVDTISSISSPNLAIARGGGLNDLLMIFTTPVTSVRLTSDDFPGEAPDIIRLMALAPTSTPNQFTVLTFDEKFDNAVSSPDNLLSVALEGIPFSYALFQVTTEQEGFDDLNFDPVRAVPEPPALALAGIGLLVMWRSRRWEGLNNKATPWCKV